MNQAFVKHALASCFLAFLLPAAGSAAAPSPVADAAMQGDKVDGYKNSP